MSERVRDLLEGLTGLVFVATILSAAVALSLVAFHMFRWAMHDAVIGLPCETVGWSGLGLVFLAPNAIGAACAFCELRARRGRR